MPTQSLEVERRGLAGEFAGLGFAEKQEVLDEPGERAGRTPDDRELIAARVGIEPVEVAAQDVRRGHDDSERRGKLVRNHGDKVGVELV